MKTSEANIEDLKGMVVSDGTMRSEDLIPKFLNVLKVYGKDVYDKYVGENPEVLDLSGMDDETMGWVVDELFDKLNEIAPEGYSFESQDGDGACYGFWSVDADERKKCEAYIQPVTLYSTTRYDDAEAVQSFLRDIGGDAVTVDKQRNGDVLSVNVSGSDDDVEAFVDTYKNEYGSIVKDCEVDATGWTAPEDIYYIATEQGRKELRGESKNRESAGETMRVDVYADRRNFDPEEFVKYVRKAGGKNGGYISVDSVVSVDVLNKANRLAQDNDYKRTESKKSEDHRRKDRYGHSVRRFTAKDLSVTPDIKITKIVPPTEEDVRKCAVTKNGKFVVFFDVDSETFKLEYNPHLEGYDGMRSVARENCSIQNLATGQTWDCTGVYTLPEWITYGGYSDYTTDHLDDPAVQAFMNPSEQMVLTQFIKPFAKDYLGVDATESKKQESEDDKLVWGVTVEYTPVNGETRRTDVAPSCYTEERAKEAAIARVTKDYGPLKDVKVIRVDKLPEWAARNIRDLVRNNKTESMSNRIENTTITEQEFSDILNAYVKEVEGNDIKPIRIEVLKTEPVEGDGTLIKLHYDARENGWSNARTYALVFGDLHKNRDNDLIYVLHDWQSGEKVTPEDIADHDWELVNNHIRPSEILDATKSAESLDPSIDVKGRGVVELIEDDYLKLSRDINSRGYCKDKDGAYNVWIGGSFKGTFPSVEAAADAGYTLVEGKRCEAQVSEKTFKQGVDEFIGAAPEGGWSDYWAMQQDWEFYKDSLCRDGVITQKQADSWSNPCTPDTFDRWQKRNGLVHRGYESKKPEDKEYNVYAGHYELIITDKVLDTPYELIDSRPLYDNLEDDLLVDYPSATIIYDQDIKDEVIANVYPWLEGESDISGVQFADFSEDTVKMESKKSESSRDITPKNIEALLDEKGLVFEKEGTPTSPTYTVYDSIKTKELAEWTHHKVGNMFYIAMTSWGGASISVLCLGGDYYSNNFVKRGIATMRTLRKYVDLIMSWFKSPNNDERVSESLTLKQKELKDMARFGQAEDITTISDVEAKELKKKGIETVGISRGAYGMNGALLRDSEGKKYVITARSSNLFYFV